MEIEDIDTFDIVIKNSEDATTLIKILAVAGYKVSFRTEKAKDSIFSHDYIVTYWK